MPNENMIGVSDEPFGQSGLCQYVLARYHPRNTVHRAVRWLHLNQFTSTNVVRSQRALMLAVVDHFSAAQNSITQPCCRAILHWRPQTIASTRAVDLIRRSTVIVMIANQRTWRRTTLTGAQESLRR